MDRLLNYAFGFVVVYLFVLFANAEEHMQIIVGLLAALIFSFAGFMLTWLTLDGAQAAFVTGVTAFGLGGLPAAVILLSFFVTGTLLTLLDQPSYEDFYGDDQPARRKRRNGIQVWANSFWFVLFIVMWFIFDTQLWLIAAISAISTAMADTWATEIGDRMNLGSTYVIKGWRKVQPGTDGGVSLTGSLGGLAGGMLIGLVAHYVYPQISISTAVLIGVVGFLGNYLDSLLGAYFQYEGQSWSMPNISDRDITLDNDGVNWAATGLGSILSLILIHLFSIS